MNDIDSMPPKCHDCHYWEICEEPYICPTQNEKLEKKKMTNKEAIEMLKNKMDGSIDTSYSWCEARVALVVSKANRA